MDDPHLHPDPAIMTATDLFWRDGYDGVSIEDLVKATGLNRYAIYQKFGGKKGIFLSALAAYCDHGKAAAQAALADPDLSAFEAIRLVIREKVSDPQMFRAGCMMTTTAVELAAKDSEVAERMLFYMAEMKGVMQGALLRAQAEGDIAAYADPAALAEILFNLFIGAGVQSRMGVPQQDLVQALDGAVCGLQQIRSS